MKALCVDRMSPRLSASSDSTVDKRREAGSKDLNNIAFRDGYNLRFLINPAILCDVMDHKGRLCVIQQSLMLMDCSGMATICISNYKWETAYRKYLDMKRKKL